MRDLNGPTADDCDPRQVARGDASDRLQRTLSHGKSRLPGARSDLCRFGVLIDAAFGKLGESLVGFLLLG